ncbi:MAG: hypothetical protein HY063_13990, partial [Bacteroidetes bacterium]|nr:hypothetical protein [Bacteroidota bacterium]
MFSIRCCREFLPLLLSILFIAACGIANAQYTKLFDFTGTANGSEPMGSLISDGTYLYGMTYIGGAGNQGAIFKIKPDGTGYTNIYYFGYNVQDGAYPKGSLLYDGNYLYGMTEDGGANNLGTIFKIRTDGTGYFKILDFAGTNGSYPAGDLISDGTTYLYGMARRGGANDLGVVFKIKPDGTGYTDLLDFAGSSNGSYPFGSLTSDGIYFNAMTNTGGTSNDGTVFKIKPDGTGFSKLLDMYGANGYDPNGSLVYDGTYMYGMTYYGGSPVHGNIFKIRTDGTGYSDLFDFNGTNGDKPTANLVFDGGILYGMTSNGGTNSLGSLFKIQTDGTGFSKLLNFSGTANGSIPYGSLLSGGGVLYGMTFQGGTSNVGTIFRYCLGPNITVNASATTVCAGTSVTLSASGANSYSWNTSQTTSSIVVSPTTLSSYSVTGTNTNACTNTAVASVNVNALPVLSVSSQSVSCSGGNNGSAVVSVSSGVSPYTYSWMPNGQTTSAVTGLSQGTNTIQVTDANGCSAQQTVSITQPAALSLSTTVTNVLCFAGNNGSISTTASGGTFPYTYSILPGNQFTNLAAGNYSITITDANSCTATKTVSITQPAILSASVSVVANASCGNPDGSAAVTPSGGVAPYTYLWSNGEVIPNPNTFLSGTYSVTVTDNNGCTSSASVTITNSNPAPPSICLITVDSISKNNLIVWDKTTYVLGDTFLIYRDTANNAYGLIGKVPYDSLSWFIDTVRTLYAANGDPNVTSWRYKLAVKDSCGNTSAKSP